MQQMNASPAQPRPLVYALQQNIRRVIVGKDDAIELMLIALICRGHVLIEDVPGVGKTRWCPLWLNPCSAALSASSSPRM